MFKAFFFDLDGTLWNSKDVIIDSIWETIMKQKKQNIPKQRLFNDLKAYRSPLKVLHNYGVRTDSSYWKTYRNNTRKINLFYDNTSEVFTNLIENEKLIGYVTSLKKEFAINLLKKFDLLEYSSVIITPSECRTSKPSPKPILEALRIISINGDETIYIGNQEIDIIAARKAGCKSGFASWGATDGTLEEPDYFFESLEDILYFVKEE